MIEILITGILLLLVFLGVCNIIRATAKVTKAIIAIVLICYLVVVLMSLDLGEIWLQISSAVQKAGYDFLQEIGVC